jgi:hydrogenase nickel incorporation protein HypB
VTTSIKVYRNLAEIDGEWARKTRQLAREHRLRVLNFIGSPGCGKTALLEQMAARLRDTLRVAVLEGDIATTRDAERLSGAGLLVSQLLTDGGCHLSAQLVHAAFAELPLDQLDLIIIENVGNMVCPACFDIGEDAKIAFLSTTEGEEKPLKYPRLFRDAAAVVVSKTDLLPHVPFVLNTALESIRNVNSDAAIFPLSAVTGEGVDEWLTWVNTFTIQTC